MEEGNGPELILKTNLSSSHVPCQTGGKTKVPIHMPHCLPWVEVKVELFPFDAPLGIGGAVEEGGIFALSLGGLTDCV